MENNRSSLLACRTTLYEAPFRPASPAESDAPEQLEITVLFTDIRHTLEALRSAGQLAQGLHSRIRLLVPQVVPYPLPLDSPPVMLEFAEHHFRVIATKQAAGNRLIDTRVEIYLCRDVDEMLDQALKPKSMIVVGGAKRFWFTSEKRLARRLRRKGHEVIFVPSSHKESMKEERVYA
jgi:hypothetical protein